MKQPLAINRRSTELWKEDTAKSVALYNEWFLNFAPATFIQERNKAVRSVEAVIRHTDYFHVTPESLRLNPGIITILRMSTTPPIARDRLIGLSGVKPSLIKNMEEGKLPKQMLQEEIEHSLGMVAHVINKLLDRELFPWLTAGSVPDETALRLARCIVADRLCGTLSDPIIRNGQEKRQLDAISRYLLSEGYSFVEPGEIASFRDMEQGTFTYHLNVPVSMSRIKVKMPIDVVIKRKGCPQAQLPLLVECKSAGDFTNTNKRRKEEAQKAEQLRSTYGEGIDFILFLCGYFDSGYLGYEAAEGIDWVWEHRITDFKKAGV
mgnify:FL=1